MAERVYCLYRVSTNKQVDHDENNQADIPMQRKACHDFAAKMGWVIVGEEQETGVSGYKVSADDRDKLQLIKKYAEQGKFDILLVFMFVPFPVSWTVKMKKKQKETQDILSYHSQAAGCSDKARAKASGGRQPIEECGRTGL